MAGSAGISGDDRRQLQRPGLCERTPLRCAVLAARENDSVAGDEHGTRQMSTTAVGIRGVRVEIVEGNEAGRELVSERERITVGSAPSNDLVLSDPTVSRFHLELAATPDGIAVRDLGSTNGTWVGSIRVREASVPPGSVLTLGTTRARVSASDKRIVALPETLGLGRILGASAVMRLLMGDVEKLARSETSVLVTGESGSGKEVVARSLHEVGPRRKKPFVVVDCAAITPSLVAAELFGHERGAFTGADRARPGAFEAADGGTLFLDELGELPEAQQAALLGAIERRRFRRVGGERDIEVDVRVLAATHRDLRSDVNAGRFRADLFYRLAVVTLRVPPLRERAEDLPMLVEHFAREAGYAGPLEALLTEPRRAHLAAHAWPGNVRELRNWVEATLAMGTSAALTPSSPPPPMDEESATDHEGSDPIGAVLERPWKEARQRVLEELELRYLARLLERSSGNVSEASRVARMDRTYLLDLLRRHGLKE